MKVKISQVRSEVRRLNDAGKTDEAAKLWKQAVGEMGQGAIIDDENPPSKELRFLG